MTIKRTILYPGDCIIDEQGEAQRIAGSEDGGVLFNLHNGRSISVGFSFEEIDFTSARAAFHEGARVVEFDEDTGRYQPWSRQ